MKPSLETSYPWPSLTRMGGTLGVRLSVATLALLSMLTTTPVKGANINITLSGSVAVLSGTVFGQTGNNVPVSATLTIDNSAPTILPLSYGSAESLYGYELTGLTGSAIKFGSKVWDMAALDLLSPETGVSAEVWFDASLEMATPTQVWMQFSDGSGSIQFGTLTTNPKLALQSTLSVTDYADTGFGNTAVGSLSIIPEPTTTLLLTGSLALLLAARRRTA